MVESSDSDKQIIIEQQMEGLVSGRIAAEFSYKKIVNEQSNFEKFKKYYDRYSSGEITSNELELFTGEWLLALKEKDRGKKSDFIDTEGFLLRRNEIAVLNSRPLTDEGNAERLIDQYGSLIRYCHEMGAWFLWDFSEGRWKFDTNEYILRVAKDVIRRILFEAYRAPIPEMEKKSASWAIQCECPKHYDGMVKLARKSKEIIIDPDSFDSDDHLFNLINGTLNLKTGEMQQQKKADHISKISNILYDSTATCPMFLNYLDRIFRSNPHKEEAIKFLQRAVGYTLTGSTEEQCLLILYGSGANGKSVFLDILLELMGEYGTTTQSKTLTTDRGGISNDIAALAGKRLVCASENSSDSTLDESLIKQLTGGEEISARFLHKEFFSFRPKFKLWWAFNHPPAISDQTLSIWRRIKIIPFTEVLPESEWDRNLAKKIKEKEMSGILNWALEGLKGYNLTGLQQPQVVTEATLDYKNEQDILLEFFDASYNFTQSDLDKVQASDLYLAYKAWWLNIEPTKPMSTTKFGRLCRDRGVKKEHTREGYFYLGLRSKFSTVWGPEGKPRGSQNVR